MSLGWDIPFVYPNHECTHQAIILVFYQWKEGGTCGVHGIWCQRTSQVRLSKLTWCAHFVLGVMLASILTCLLCPLDGCRKILGHTWAVVVMIGDQKQISVTIVSMCHCGLAIYTKEYLKAKEFQYFTMQKYIFRQNPLKETNSFKIS